MDRSNLIDLTIYLVGANKDEALERMPFESWEAAHSYAKDENLKANIYAITAYMDPSTIEIVR